MFDGLMSFFKIYSQSITVKIVPTKGLLSVWSDSTSLLDMMSQGSLRKVQSGERAMENNKTPLKKPSLKNCCIHNQDQNQNNYSKYLLNRFSMETDCGLPLRAWPGWACNYRLLAICEFSLQFYFTSPIQHWARLWIVNFWPAGFKVDAKQMLLYSYRCRVLLL